MFLADFHVHSTFSDGKLSIPELIDLYGSRGFGAIAITDHVPESHSLIGKAAQHLGLTITAATFPIYREILRTESERAMDQYGMVVIPGFELSKNSISNHRSAHIIGLGIDQLIFADGDVTDLIKKIHDQGALAIAAHPVPSGKLEKQTYHLWNRREELADKFDAWEVASGQILFDKVMRAKLPKIASSDLHIRRHFSSWKTVLECERNPEAILEAIKKQQLSFRYYEETAHGLIDSHVFPLVYSDRPYHPRNAVSVPSAPLGSPLLGRGTSGAPYFNSKTA